MFGTRDEFAEWLNEFQVWFEVYYGREDLEERTEYLLSKGVVAHAPDNYVSLGLDSYRDRAGHVFWITEYADILRGVHPDILKPMLEAMHPALYDIHMVRWYAKGGGANDDVELLLKHPLLYDPKSGLVFRPEEPTRKVTLGEFLDVVGSYGAVDDRIHDLINTARVEGKNDRQARRPITQVLEEARGSRPVGQDLPPLMNIEQEAVREEPVQPPAKRKRPVDGDWMTDEELEAWYRKYTKFANWQGIYDLAKEGDLDMAGQLRPDIAIRNYANLTKIQTRFISGRNSNHLRGIWIWGSSGSGKSTLARMVTGGQHYVKLANKWWDGYRGEKYVILDDLMPPHRVLGYHLKLWADRHDTTGEVKGGAVGLAYEWLIVTSQYSIDQIFTQSHGQDEVKDTETISALKRRFLVLRPNGLFLRDGEELLGAIQEQAIAIRQTLDHIESTGEIPRQDVVDRLSREEYFGY